MKRIGLTLSLLVLAILSSKAQNIEYPKNIIRAYALNAFVYGGVGVGLGYERILDKEGKLGVNIPLHFAFSQNVYDNSLSGGYSGDLNHFALMFNPGFKFYPNGQRRATYGIGISIFGQYNSEDRLEYLQSGGNRLVTQDDYRLGLLINNSVQFNITKRFNLGLEIGVGPSYLNKYYDSYTNKYQNRGNIDFMAQFGMHIGFRF